MTRPLVRMAMILMAAAACPAATPPEDRVLTLPDALALAGRHRALLAGARSRTEEIRARRREVSGERLPRVEAQAVRVGGLSGAKGNGLQIAGVVSSQLVRDNAAGVNVRQLLYDSGEVKNRKRALAHQIVAARADEAVTLRQVGLDVVAAYVEVQKQEALLALAGEVLEQRSAFVGQAESAQRAGLRSEVDVTLARVQAARGRSLVAAAEARRDVAWAALRRAMGSPPDAPSRLGPVEPATHADAAGEADLRAIDVRPEVVSATEARTAASHEVTAVRATRRPQLVGFLSGGAANTPESGDDLEWAGGVAVKLPLDVSRQFHERERQARLREEQARARLTEAQELVKQEVGSATAEYRNLTIQLEVARTEVDAAQAALKVADAQYRAGLGAFYDRLVAENALLDARTRHDSARFEMFLGRVRLEVARGRDVAEAISVSSARQRERR